MNAKDVINILGVVVSLLTLIDHLLPEIHEVIEDLNFQIKLLKEEEEYDDSKQKN